jgi:hypothetical protein
LSLTKEQILGYIKALHPEVLDPAHGVAERGVDPNISNLPALQLTQEDVLAAIRHLPRGSAAGFNGWTYDAVRSICLYLPNQANFAEALVILFNKMLRGDMPFPENWTAGRSVLLPKADGKWRPICVGDVWYRIMARAINSKVSVEVGKLLTDVTSAEVALQLGCGIRGGSEIAGRLAQTAVDFCLSHREGSKLVLINLDVSNAFGTVRRCDVLKGLIKYFPGLVKFFLWSHGRASPLFNSAGELLVQYWWCPSR